MRRVIHLRIDREKSINKEIYNKANMSLSYIIVLYNPIT